jgi:hypothetical protein
MPKPSPPRVGRSYGPSVRADPSGAVELGEAIGREGDVDRLWSALMRGNVRLSGRWGVGKTTITRLAIADAPTGWTGRRASLGALRGAAAAVAAIVESLSLDPDAGESLQAAIAPMLETQGHLVPDKLGGDPSSLLRTAVEAQLDDRRVGLMIALDDFDQFLKGSAGSAGLEAFTNALAALSGPQTRVRVLMISNTNLDRTLSRVRPLSRELFECARMTLEPLTPESGSRLVSALLLGESITARDRAALARALSDSCDHIPRWIHCAMGHFVARRKPILDGDLERALVEAVSDLDREPWALRRELQPVLEDYYQPTRGLAYSVLDQIALSDDRALTFSELREHVAMETTIDEDAIRRVLAELKGDQLIQESGGRLSFAGELLRMAWVRLRFI